MEINAAGERFADTLKSAGVFGTQDMGKQDFLNLLITQLTNQDPMAPQDSVEFVSQLAQFSSLEQLTNLNGEVEELQSWQSIISDSLLVNYLGKEIYFRGDRFEVREGQAELPSYRLLQDADKVEIKVYRDSGELVKTVQLGRQSAGDHEIPPLTDNEGKPLADGSYTFEVNAWDDQENPLQAAGLIRGEVTGLTRIQGVPYLLVGDRQLPLKDIIQVFNGSQA